MSLRCAQNWSPPGTDSYTRAEHQRFLRSIQIHIKEKNPNITFHPSHFRLSFEKNYRVTNMELFFRLKDVFET